MSRSFRNMPIVKDNRRGRKRAKRQANKKVRTARTIANGKQYRKVFNPWNIYDFFFYCTLQEYLQNEKEFKERPLTEKEIIEETKAWKKTYYWK